MCKFILLLSLLFFIQDSIPMEKSQRGDSLSDSSYYEEPIPIGKVNRRNLKYDTKRDMYYKDDGWNEYKKSKEIDSRNKRLKILLHLYYDDIDKKCKGWVAHDIGEIYAEKYSEHTCKKKYEYKEEAIHFYKRAIKYGDKDCRKTTNKDIDYYSLSKYIR